MDALGLQRYHQFGLVQQIDPDTLPQFYQRCVEQYLDYE